MNPHLWAIIPVKPFHSGKSRLAALLDLRSRAALNRRLFDHVFNVALAAVGPGHTAVVTADADLAATVGRRGAHAVSETSMGDLNAALGQACRFASARGARAVLVLPSDLPFVTVEDIAALATVLGNAPSCAIAPDMSGQATNALAIAPPDPDFFRFGPGSFAAHMRAAAARGATVESVRRPGLAFDLDTPGDYRTYSENVVAAAPS